MLICGLYVLQEIVSQEDLVFYLRLDKKKCYKNQQTNIATIGMCSYDGRQPACLSNPDIFGVVG